MQRCQAITENEAFPPRNSKELAQLLKIFNINSIPIAAIADENNCKPWWQLTMEENLAEITLQKTKWNLLNRQF